MREKINENPMAQVALIGALLLAAVFLLLKPMGGGESEESASGETAATATAPSSEATAEGAAGGEGPAATTVAPTSLPAPPLPRPVMTAYESGNTVVLLVVHPGGIDDDLVATATASLGRMPGVATFIVPATKIARYAAITDRVGVDRVPALLVLRPKALSHGTPTVSVSYGFQNSQNIVQAVVDAGYKGRTLSYHP